MLNNRSDNNPDVTNTLRLGTRELNALLDRIEESNTDSPNPDREFKRWNFRIVQANLRIEHAGGSTVTIPVATRNISRGGISVLHSAFVYPKSRCNVELTLENGQQLDVEGLVVRCTHIGGKVHEIGIKFDEQISTRDLLGLDPMKEAYSLESIDPDRLLGTVLLITGSEMDQQLMMNFLESTSLSVNVASDSEVALKRGKKGCELILTDSHIAGESGAEIVSQLRAEGIDCPILVMTSDDSNTTRDEMRMAGASGYLSKPITRVRLLQALAEFLLADGDGGPIYSTLSTSDPAYGILTKFFTDVPRMVLTLEKALKSEDETTVTEICRTLSGTGAPLGFEIISTLASSAERSLSAGAGIREAASDIRQLIIACRRIKARPNNAA